jgi:hypothetical protein
VSHEAIDRAIFVQANPVCQADVRHLL